MTFSALLVLGWLGQAPVPVPVPDQPTSNPAAVAESAPEPPTTTEPAKGSLKYDFVLGGKSEGIAPAISGSADTDKGKIEVTPEDNALKVVLTGGVGANVFFGRTSSATQSIQVIQEFEITCSDPSISQVALTLESSLLGIIRSKHRAGACLRLASATIAPVGSSEAALSVSYPVYCVNGDQGYAYKEPLEPVKSQLMPLGRYVIQANMVMSAEASGVRDAHSTAVFAPKSEELDPLEREHDPFAGEKHDGYGFTLTLKADSPPGSPKVVHKKPSKKVSSRARAAQTR